MNLKRAGLALLLIVGIGSCANGQADQIDHSMHDKNARHDAGALTEPGQGAFAALSEIVVRLEADPETDWSQINLTALRNHLVDMDLLITDTVAAHTKLENGLRIEVTGDQRSLAAAQRMVSAHAAFLRDAEDWTIDVTHGDDSVIMVVTADAKRTVSKIKALGFYGLMASQDHHRAHHWGMALGGSAH